MDKITQEENKKYFADWVEGKITEQAYKKLVSKNEFLVSKKLDATFNVLKELDKPMDNMLKNIKKSSTKKNVKTISLYTKWATGIAAVFLLMFGLNTFLKVKDFNVYSEIGEQKTIALLDNSEVILNAKSSISYNSKSWKNKRELFLEGEAYFKVTKKGSTFTVNTNNGSVTVLGTHFNVKTNVDYFLVTCYEGKVKVIDTNNKVTILTAGKSVVSSKNNAVNKMVTISEPTWISGKTSFDNTPLKIVLNDLENQFNITFDKKNIDLNQNYTGAISNTNLNVSLNSVFKPMQIDYIKKGKTIILNP